MIQGRCVQFLSLSAFSWVLLPLGSFADSDAPPYHLPRVIFECEAAVGANSSTCSAWIWRAGSYSAVWSIGAIGQLSVNDAKNGEVGFQRADSAGLFSGLTGTYTGKFDGSHFNDGNVTFSLKGASNRGVWSGVAEVTPVVHTHLGMIQTVTQEEVYGVGRQPPAPYTNFYTAELTGYAIYTERWVGSGVKGTVIEDFRTVGEAPMKPGDHRPVNLRSPRIPIDYDPGGAYRPGMAVAAIYADGTSFGDSRVLVAMMERRRSMLAALTTIGGTICQFGKQRAAMPEVDAALAKQRTAEDARSPTGKAGRDAAYDYVTSSLHPRGRLTDGEKLKRSWEMLDKVRMGLADPVKDRSGQPMVAVPTALVCNLPG